MKKLIVAAIAATVAVGAHADIFASFAAGYGIEGNGSAGGIVDAVDGTELVLQLINGNGDGLDYSDGNRVVYNDVSGMFEMQGNDLLIGTLSAVVTSGGSDYSDFANTISGIIQAPWVADTYVRVSGIAQDDWVWESSLIALDDKDMSANPAPQTTIFDNGGTGGIADGSIQVTVIPEPATIGLMGIAGIGMFLARRKTRR